MAIVAASHDSTERAADRLIAGELVVFPTETVYGLGADAGQAKAVAAIYRLKGRPADHPLIVHAADVGHIRGWAVWNDRAERLAAACWPGALTLILQRARGVPDAACGGQSTIGLRIPSHPVALALLRAFHDRGGEGVAAPSANRFGRVSPTTAQHVIDDLGADAPMILDGGACGVGLESTIVDLSRSRSAVLRPGGIDVATIETVLGESLDSAGGAGDSAPRVSGSLAAHYAPGRPLELLPPQALAQRIQDLDARGLRLAVWSVRPPRAGSFLWRPMPDEPVACGRALFARLRELDRSGADVLLIEHPPDDLRWAAVIDRLTRAAVGAGSAAR
jgi:L-threonylcarbamoyladenylate synthase